MLSSSIQVVLQLAGYLLYSIAHVFFYYIIYILLVTSIKSLYKLITQVYNGSLKSSPSSERAILITGATSGFGLALSKHFNAQGYSIIAGYCTDQEDGYGELARLNQEKGGKSIFLVHVDVRSQESIKESYEMVNGILKENQLKLHALINNAGILKVYPAHWTQRRDIVATAEINFIGPMLMVRQYMPLLIRTPGSRIINVSSLAGRLPFPNNAVYCATKAGLAMFGDALAFDISKHNVKVVTIYVGNALHHTAIANKLASELSATYEEFSPEERALYEHEFQDHERGLKTIERLIKDFQSGKTSVNAQLSSIRRQLTNFSGSVRSKIKLEDSCFMESFDNAINMRNPPSELSAGNRPYSIFASSFLDTVGHDIVQLIGSLASSCRMEEYV